MTEEEYHQWELEQQEKEELEVKRGNPRNPSHKSFHENFTPNIWKDVAKDLKRSTK